MLLDVDMSNVEYHTQSWESNPAPLVVLQSLKQYSLAELLEAVLIHLDSGDILMLLDVHVSNIEPNVGKFGGRLPNFGEDHSSLSYVTWNSNNI